MAYRRTPCGATVPVCELPVLLVTSVFTVTDELLRSAALLCTTCALLSLSAPATLSCTGNWMPVLLSGGIWFQSTSSSVSIELGSLGYILMANEFVPERSVPVTSKVNRVYAPVTVDFVATCLPSTNTSAAPTTPLTMRLAVCPAARFAVKSVRYHHGTLNFATLTGPFELVNPKHLRMLSEKKTLAQPPFCSSASISVPGAPASSGVTDNHPAVLNPGVEICW